DRPCIRPVRERQRRRGREQVESEQTVERQSGCALIRARGHGVSCFSYRRYVLSGIAPIRSRPRRISQLSSSIHEHSLFQIPIFFASMNRCAISSPSRPLPRNPGLSPSVIVRACAIFLRYQSTFAKPNGNSLPLTCFSATL